MVRSFRSIAAALAALAIPLAAAPTAPADVPTYTQYACHTPDGAPAPVNGFSSTANNGGSATNNCADGGGLTMVVPTTAAGGSYVSAAWAYNPPPGIDVASVTYHRTVANVGAADSSTTRDWVAPGDSCGAGVPCSADASVTTSLGAMWFASFLLQCQSDSPCHGPYAGDGRAVVDSVAVAIQDTDVPQFTRQPNGDLFSGGSVSGTRSVSFAVTDNGGGVYEAAFMVDGAQEPLTIVDRNDGTCVEPFTSAPPCKSAVEPTLELDTTKLSNGHHTIAVIVYDATKVNAVSSAPMTVDVENPPSAGATGSPAAAGSGGSDPAVTSSGTPSADSSPIGSVRLALFGASRNGRLGCRYGRIAIIRGRLADSDGTPEKGATVHVLAVRGGALVATGLTDNRGRFRIGVRSRISQSLLLESAGIRPVRVRVVVRPTLSVVASKSHLENGQSLSLQARTPVRGRARIAFQVQIGKIWRTFATRRLSTNGTATVRHRFTVTYTRLTYRFRARIVPGAGFPYSGAESKPVSVLVN